MHWVVLEDSGTRWTWTFDTEIIPKVQATLIHLSFNAGMCRREVGPDVRNPSPTHKATTSPFEVAMTKGLGC